MTTASPATRMGGPSVSPGARPRVMVLRRADRPLGGDIYEEMIAQCLRGACDVVDFASPRANGIGRYWNTIRTIRDVRRQVPRRAVDVVVLNQDAALMRPRSRAKRVVMLHHIDYSCTLMGWVYAALRPRLYRVLAEADAVVVPGRFWRDALQTRGVRNVHIIPNGFNVEQFSVDHRDVEAFRLRHGLTGKPIIYLGTTGRQKGGAEAYRILQRFDAHFVVTGPAPAPVPRVRHLRLAYREYLQLLAASTVAVTMSQFDEGWCRVAHEAMACGTPVVGSGRGGMRELLEDGGQCVCPEFAALPAAVEPLLRDPGFRDRMRSDGIAYGRRFTLERFTRAWTELITRLVEVGS
ncbi:MAG TPA: glycosyltransferase family 4 protein [Gemmataceae bacterium]|jgi:glycosyltransferase involved in cell wall biosynthesis|nr:glycosyltransferase family 4 protein [Gemmataceae bacterium]